MHWRANVAHSDVQQTAHLDMAVARVCRAISILIQIKYKQVQAQQQTKLIIIECERENNKTYGVGAVSVRLVVIFGAEHVQLVSGLDGLLAVTQQVLELQRARADEMQRVGVPHVHEHALMRQIVQKDALLAELQVARIDTV